MITPKQEAAIYWRKIQIIYKQKRKETFGEDLRKHNSLVVTALFLALAAAIWSIALMAMNVTDIKGPGFIVLYALLGTALILIGFSYFIVDKRIDESKSPGLWIDAIKEYSDKLIKEGNGAKKPSEILLCLHNNYKPPFKKRLLWWLARFSMFAFVCIACPVIESQLELPVSNSIIIIVNGFIAFLFGKYMNVVEDVFLKIALDCVLYDRMKRETPLEMIDRMKEGKVS